MKLRLWHIAAAVAVLSLVGTYTLTRRSSVVTTPELAQTWSTALGSLEGGDVTGAKLAFTEWIEKAEARGVHSPEAHFNLGMALWSLKEQGPAVYHFLKSALFSVSPGDLWRAHDILAGTQRDLGVSDAITRSWTFRLYLWISENYSLLLFFGGLWSLIALFLFRRSEGKAWPLWQPLALLLIPAALIGLGVTGQVNRLRGVYAVLDGNEGTVGLFPDPRQDANEKLLDLPTGTLVFSSEEVRNGMVKVESPIVAWVAAEQIKLAR